ILPLPPRPLAYQRKIAAALQACISLFHNPLEHVSHVRLQAGRYGVEPYLVRIGPLQEGFVATDEPVIEGERGVCEPVPERGRGVGTEVAKRSDVLQLDQTLDLVTERRVHRQTRSLTDLIQLRVTASDRTHDGLILGDLPQALLLENCGLYQATHLAPRREHQPGRIIGKRL